MELIKAIILGIVQGATDFLPVSSSGHLVLGSHILGFQEQG
ncbi:MAG: UDP-diphosphatase, partial [Desulfofustis sp.]|nr:UDP-diphosphatase [Desulfofustis sp.]